MRMSRMRKALPNFPAQSTTSPQKETTPPHGPTAFGMPLRDLYWWLAKYICLLRALWRRLSRLYQKDTHPVSRPRAIVAQPKALLLEQRAAKAWEGRAEQAAERAGRRLESRSES